LDGTKKGKIVNPFFETIIDKVGRWEEYIYENKVMPFSLDKYIEYLENNVEKPAKIKIKNKGDYYSQYLMNFRKIPSSK
jgi:hypothetical protein